jgi:hypothetical protein
MKWDQIQNMEIDGISKEDYPDMANATVVYAEWKNGQKLNDQELDTLNDLFAETVQELAREWAL